MTNDSKSRTDFQSTEDPERIKAIIGKRAREMLERGPPDYPNSMIPPWQQFPELPRMSLGWRMGGGEDYRSDFGDWFFELAESDRENYINGHPEPEGWHDFYKILIERRTNGTKE